MLLYGMQKNPINNRKIVIDWSDTGKVKNHKKIVPKNRIESLHRFQRTCAAAASKSLAVMPSPKTPAAVSPHLPAA